MDYPTIEQLIKYSFKDKNLLRTAVTHSSYFNEHKDEGECYERFEFLGDSILNFASSKHIFENYPTLTEGQLTKLRSTLVCEKTLAAIILKLKLDGHILISKGEVRTSGCVRPSILADVFEAIAAAIFLDGGLQKAEEFILPNLIPYIDLTNRDKDFSDYKSLLQEHIQARDGLVSYTVINQHGPEHDKVFVVCVKVNDKSCGEGKGRSKKEAAQNAAKNALMNLGLLNK